MRHLLIPDTQIRKGVPNDHLSWAAQAVLEYKPDRTIHIGDHWDMPSLSLYDPVGSEPARHHNVEEDFEYGNAAFALLAKPLKRTKTEKHFLRGNHEDRVERALYREPKYAGLIGNHKMDTQDFKVYPYLERLWLDGICFSHFFQNMLSSYAVGGEITNRLNKIGDSFVQGHEQGFRYGNRVYPTGRTRHGLVQSGTLACA